MTTLKRDHPHAGPRQRVAPGGEQARRQVGRGHAEAQRGETDRAPAPAGAVSAVPSATPMNGAVQGEATATASTPASESSATDGEHVQMASPPGRTLPNSKVPARLRPTSVNTTASSATKVGDCNWKPQPSCCRWHAARAEGWRAARNERPPHPPCRRRRRTARARRSSPCCAKLSTFSESTGNTHGIRLSMVPPTNASSSDISQGATAPVALSRPLTSPPAAEAGAGAVPSAVPDAGAAPDAVAPPDAPPAAGRAGAVPGAGAAAVAGDAPTIGQAPAMGKLTRMPRDASSRRRTAFMAAGLSVRLVASASGSTTRSPFHSGRTGAAVSSTPGSSTNTCTGLARIAPGTPLTVTTSDAPSKRPDAAKPAIDTGAAAKAVRNNSACAANAPTGTSSRNSPASGMQTSLQTSHSARSCTGSDEPEKPEGTRKGTGSSKSPS